MTPPPPPSTTELTQWIRAQGKALGFSHMAILPPLALEDEGAHLDAWLSQGFHADMEWMANHRHLRTNPGAILEGTQSLILVTLNYFQPDPPDPDPDSVKIAKYARGQDYHHVLKDKLFQLLQGIQERVPDANGRPVVDSAPVLEKALAHRSGLGWIGKNGTFITPDRGSFLFLGELLLTLPLDYDTPTLMANHCGRCTRCISACPTDAIIEQPGYPSHTVDANRCIAYWTIEYKGETLPQDISSHLEGWVFGCDICQDVCPWNVKFAIPTEEPAFQPLPWRENPSILELLALDKPTFKSSAKGTPLLRTGLQGLQRNVQAWQTHRPN